MKSEDVLLWLKKRIGKEIHLHDSDTIECIAITLRDIEADLLYLDNILEEKNDTSGNIQENI